MKNIITEMKTTLQGTNNRTDEAEDQVSNFEENKEAENIQLEQQKEKRIPPK